MAKYDFEMPATLEDAEIAVILTKADELAAWAAELFKLLFAKHRCHSCNAEHFFLIWVFPCIFDCFFQ